MKTSSFDNYRYTQYHSGVCIAIKHPDWFVGPKYPDLFPKWSFLRKYFKDKDEAVYKKAYYNQVLKKLNPQQVLKDLKDSILLCWEPSGKFCHRRIVADWIEYSLGINVLELDI